MNRLVWCVCLWLVAAPVWGQTTHEVASEAQFDAACAAASPGDTIEITDGMYSNWIDVAVTCSGTMGSPITITCDTKEGCIFSGDNNFEVFGDWIVFDGLRFTARTSGFGSNFDGIIHFHGAQNGRVTNTGFDNINNAGVTMIAVNSISVSPDESDNIEVDNNRVEDSNALFLYVTIRDDTAGFSSGHDIHHNYFEDNQVTSSQPYIRFGSHTEWADIDVDSDIRNNTFIRTKTTRDMIHHKGTNIRFTNNYLEDTGYLTLRQGHDNTITHNYLLRPVDNHGSGANFGVIRITGQDHTITNNVLIGDPTANVSGKGAVFEFGTGDSTEGNEQHYETPEGVLFANNTLINFSEDGIWLGRFEGSGSNNGARNDPPNNNTIQNNIFDSDAGEHIDVDNSPTNTIDSNLFWGSASVGTSGTNAVTGDNPDFVSEFDDVSLQSGSPAIDVGATIAAVTDDYLGTARPQNSVYDIGAYEFVSGGGSAPSAPSGLSAVEAGPSQINLTWVDNAGDEDNFEIERATPTCSGFSLRATVGENVVAYVDVGLAANTTYCYRVRATNTSGNSSYSNTDTATTLIEPPDPTNIGRRLRGVFR